MIQRTITAFGNARITNAGPKIGTGSAIFESSDAHLEVTPSQDFDDLFNTPLTVECYVTLLNFPNQLKPIICMRKTTMGLFGWQLVYRGDDGSKKFQLYIAGSNITITSINSYDIDDSWIHLAFTVDNTTIKFYVNGVLQGTGTMTGYATAGANLFIGGRQDGATSIIGIDDLRISNSVRYYTDFTPPTSQGSLDQNRLLYLIMDGAENSTDFVNFIFDQSVPNAYFYKNAFISNNRAKAGSLSAAFDGNSDAVIINHSNRFNPGTGDFTLEYWIYETTLDGTTFFFEARNSETGLNQFAIIGNATTTWFWASGSNRITGPAIAKNQWVHMAVSRQNQITRLFINGVQAGSNYTDTNNYQLPNLTLGMRYNGSATSPNTGVTGNIDDFRISEIARYTTNFTPNSGYTLDPNTKILLNFETANNTRNLNIEYFTANQESASINYLSGFTQTIYPSVFSYRPSGMRSLSELNDWYQTFTLEYMDERDSQIVFDKLVPVNPSISINENTNHIVPLGIDIVDIIEGQGLNIKFIVDVTQLPDGAVTWDNIPSGCTVTQVNKVYFISGITTVDIWEQIKAPQVASSTLSFGDYQYLSSITYGQTDSKQWTIYLNVQEGWFFDANFGLNITANRLTSMPINFVSSNTMTTFYNVRRGGSLFNFVSNYSSNITPSTAKFGQYNLISSNIMALNSLRTRSSPYNLVSTNTWYAKPNSIFRPSVNNSSNYRLFADYTVEETILRSKFEMTIAPELDNSDLLNVYTIGGTAPFTTTNRTTNTISAQYHDIRFGSHLSGSGTLLHHYYENTYISGNHISNLYRYSTSGSTLITNSYFIKKLKGGIFLTSDNRLFSVSRVVTPFFNDVLDFEVDHFTNTIDVITYHTDQTVKVSAINILLNTITTTNIPIHSDMVNKINKVIISDAKYGVLLNNNEYWNASITSPYFVKDSNLWKDLNYRSNSSSFANEYGIKTDGTLWSKGNHNYLGHSSANPALTEFTQIGTDTNWNSIITTDDVIFVTKTNGDVYVWGRNNNYNLGFNNDSTNRFTPTLNTFLKGKQLYPHDGGLISVGI